MCYKMQYSGSRALISFSVKFRNGKMSLYKLYDVLGLILSGVRNTNKTKKRLSVLEEVNY